MATISSAVTGREKLDDILAVFSKTAKRLDTFIGQRQADVQKFTATEQAARSAAGSAKDDIDRAARTKAKIADLVA
jgi:hypothetical protein